MQLGPSWRRCSPISARASTSRARTASVPTLSPTLFWTSWRSRCACCYALSTVIAGSARSVDRLKRVWTALTPRTGARPLLGPGDDTRGVDPAQPAARQPAAGRSLRQAQEPRLVDRHPQGRRQHQRARPHRPDPRRADARRPVGRIGLARDAALVIDRRRGPAAEHARWCGLAVGAGAAALLRARRWSRGSLGRRRNPDLRGRRSWRPCTVLLSLALSRRQVDPSCRDRPDH